MHLFTIMESSLVARGYCVATRGPWPESVIRFFLRTATESSSLSRACGLSMKSRRWRALRSSSSVSARGVASSPARRHSRWKRRPLEENKRTHIHYAHEVDTRGQHTAIRTTLQALNACSISQCNWQLTGLQTESIILRAAIATIVQTLSCYWCEGGGRVWQSHHRVSLISLGFFLRSSVSLRASSAQGSTQTPHRSVSCDGSRSR